MRAPWPLAALLTVASACAGADASQRRSAPKPAEQRWFTPPAGLARDPRLEEAAALLCARETDNVIDDDARRGGRVFEGQVAAAVERGRPPLFGPVMRIGLAAKQLAKEVGATHYGVVELPAAGGETCLGLVVARRVVDVSRALPAFLEAPAPFPLAVKLLPPFERASVFLMRPDGGVEKSALAGDAVVEPRGGEGRYVLEIVASGAADAPEVVLLWPFTVGKGSLPPAPAVLFPDEGHSDVALTRRLEALVHRLRVEQQLAPITIAPPLGRLSMARALSLAEAGRLGHRLPDDKSALEALRKSEPAFPVVELAEVQAQAGTLEEAWRALLESPAHRYELVGTRASHHGAAVVRGQDGLGRPLVSVVVLLARRIQLRPPAEVRTELLGRLNLARDVVGRSPLRLEQALDALAQAHAEAMAKAQALDENALGEPISQRALAASDALFGVRVVIARVDDPLRIAPSDATLDGDAEVIGIGLVPPEAAGQWYVSLLLGDPW